MDEITEETVRKNAINQTKNFGATILKINEKFINARLPRDQISARRQIVGAVQHEGSP